MKVRYLISEQAIADINDIWLFTFHKWSKKQADNYYNSIIKEIEFIAANYYSGKSVDYLRNNYGVTRVKSHLIFYRKRENTIVEIVRVLHQRMDVKRKLK